MVRFFFLKLLGGNSLTFVLVHTPGFTKNSTTSGCNLKSWINGLKGADEGLGWGDPLAVSGKDLGVESDWHPLGPEKGAWHPTPGLSDTIQLTSSFENTLLFKVVRFVLSVFFGSPVVVSLTVASPLRTKTRPALIRSENRGLADCGEESHLGEFNTWTTSGVEPWEWFPQSSPEKNPHENDKHLGEKFIHGKKKTNGERDSVTDNGNTSSRMHGTYGRWIFLALGGPGTKPRLERMLLKLLKSYYTIWKVDYAATPMYWFIMAPYKSPPFGSCLPSPQCIIPDCARVLTRQ